MSTKIEVKAIKVILTRYVAEKANERFIQLKNRMQEDKTITLLVSKIGEALEQEEIELIEEITNVMNGMLINVRFDSYRYSLTKSREMIETLEILMGWI